MAARKDTSWQAVAGWYDELLGDDDTYQAKVILPNLTRLMEIRKGERVLDIACGQGFFSHTFAAAGAEVTGTDLSSELVKKAAERSPQGASFLHAPAHDMKQLKDASFDKASIVLALQNIKEARETVAEAARLLRPSGNLYIVLNHPSFRIPQASSWEKDAKTGKQYRRIDAYMNESESSIIMEPSKGDKSAKTYSFHRPLQWYVKALAKAGFAVTRLEEWISHKESQKGPHKAEEDRIRKEIPMFMCIEARKIS